MSKELEMRMKDETGTIRRVVIANRRGKSVVVDDTELPVNHFFGFKTTEVWETVGIPNIPIEDAVYKKQLTLEIPPPGDTRIRLVLVSPDEEVFRKAKEGGLDPVEEWRKLSDDEFRMHSTDTIDCGFIVSGEVWLKLDDEAEVHLKAGDCVILDGSRHGWRNKSSQNCVMLAIMTGAKRLQ